MDPVYSCIIIVDTFGTTVLLFVRLHVLYSLIRGVAPIIHVASFVYTLKFYIATRTMYYCLLKQF